MTREWGQRRFADIPARFTRLVARNEEKAMMQKKLKKSDFKKFFEDLKKEYKIFAPTKKGTITAYNFGTFDYIEDVKWLNLDRNPISSPKKLFMPDGEALFKFEKMGNSVILKDTEHGWKEKRVLLGVRPCDIAAMAKFDKVFNEAYDDPYYRERRKNTLIIGMTCNETTDDSCFCTVTESGPDSDSGYDLLMTDIGSNYFFRSGSKEGERLLEKSYFKDASPKDIQARTRKLAEIKKDLERKNKLDLKDIKEAMAKAYDSKLWDPYGKRCVTCGACNMVCPTCHCFTILDKANVGQTEGKRVRIWDSCHYDKFAKMAGGFDIRPEKVSRLKHRLYDKFYYPFITYGEGFCVGCGRCIRHCQSEIDIRGALREVADE
jgi:sulfhydrogenase subunit beta (sulfur reductase)